VTGCDHAQRLAEYLIRRACHHLPEDIRDERYQEWTAELPAILYSPDTRYQAIRVARALCYAADHTRGARRYPRTAGKSRVPVAAARSPAPSMHRPSRNPWRDVAGVTAISEMALLLTLNWWTVLPAGLFALTIAFLQLRTLRQARRSGSRIRQQ
jgi:hypothetical protein